MFRIFKPCKNPNAYVTACRAANWKSAVSAMLEDYTETNDGGSALPNLYLVCGSRLAELCGLQSSEQVFALAGLEMQVVGPEADLILIATMATENQRG